MNPDEWNAGIRNEAESVPDPVWSEQARRHARWIRTWRSGRDALLVLLGSVLLSVGLTLTVLWPVLAREAARNSVSVGTFLLWGLAGNHGTVVTTTFDTDPHLPIAFLLTALGVGAALAARRGVHPSWILFAAVCGWTMALTQVSFLSSPIHHWPWITGLLPALAVAALGILADRTLPGRWRRTSHPPVSPTSR